MAKFLKKYWLILGFVLVSVFLNLHNAFIYDPKYGFDASGHIGYIRYLTQYGKLPLPGAGWEFSQPPLYYLLGALLTSIGLPIQIINLVAFYLIAYLLWKITQSSFGLLSYLALPMASIFPPLISNELLSGLFIIFGLTILLNLADHKSRLKKQLALFVLVFTLGFYSKTTSLILLPLLPVSLFLRDRRNILQQIKNSLLTLFVCGLFISPFIARNIYLYHKPLVINDDFFVMNGQKDPRNLNFFTNINWIIKTDTVNAHDYSFVGGLWNTYWLDGERVIAPIIDFNKKALVLWLLGFPLFALSVYGFYQYRKVNFKNFIILSVFLTISVISLALYNLRLPYNSVLKSFFAFGVVLPYCVGISEALRTKFRYLLMILLVIQFATLFVYLYIQPWWHVARIN